MFNVGCVPPAAVAVPGGLPLPLEADTPQSRRPRPDPNQLSPWVWAWKLAMHTGIPSPPGDLLQGMLGHHLQCMLGYHTPVNRITEACENITLHQLRCGR